MSNLISREKRDEILLRSFQLLREVEHLRPRPPQQAPPPDRITLDLTDAMDALRNGHTFTYEK